MLHDGQQTFISPSSHHRQEVRRTLKGYGIEEGEHRFGLDLSCPTRPFPVEYEMAASIGLRHNYQLTAYAMLAEHTLGRTVEWRQSAACSSVSDQPR
ncbi:MAG: hypothetical protein H0U04_15570 [Rubrobacter sp.]|nr:hypothetical protein [Rubrobacter sp.]